MVAVNSRGQIIGDEGIRWLADQHGFFSVEPHGYFIETVSREHEVFRKTESSYPEKIPYVRQVLGRGSVYHCMRIAEIYEIRRV